MYLGRALYFEGELEEARARLEMCAVRAPEFRPCLMYLAPVYAELQRPEDAAATVAHLLAMSPGFTIERSVRRHPPFAEETMQRYIAGLRRAGVPEQ